MVTKAKRKRRRKRRSQKGARSTKPKHVVLNLGLEPMEAPDPDCPECRRLLEEGEEIHTLDLASGEIVPIGGAPAAGPDGKTLQLTLEADDFVAEALGDHEVLILLPAASRVWEMLAFLRFTEPRFAESFPEAAVEVRRKGQRLGREEELRDGERLELVARRMPAGARPN